ncbi:endoglucanase G-like [Mytilus californianus]|uniref:endoglucanase G-like n=1 Tax=Mytilus californianus TaxID=6549 RepID=UPI0022487025|nr:endoglucanase G-like [Mytilus californianus]
MTTTMTSVNDWGGRMEGHFRFQITEELNGWECFITFSSPITKINQWMGDEIEHSTDNSVHILVNRRHTGVKKIGDTLDITVQLEYSGTKPTGTAVLKNLGVDTFTVPPLPNNDGTKYNYDEVLEKSILFYAAQRSGKLPADNPIPWRNDSALLDKGQNGEDLTGGWYDAGDNVKFGFPMSATVTILAWGLLEFKDAYFASEELGEMYDCIRWPLEWMLKCHTGKNELYVQVGDGGKDHAFWGRPEDMQMDRPAFKITETNPGSDVAAEYAAAMAVGSMVFKEKDPVFSAKLLAHAKQLYDFAKTYKGIYSTSVPEAAAYYRSVMYEDELSWGGAWLYMATNDSQYLDDAEKNYQTGAAWGQSWDDKNTGNMILLYNITKKDIYKQDLEQTFKNWMPGGTGGDALPYTPKGLAFRLQWGSLRYASNMAFMALLAAEVGMHPTEYRKWAKSQIGYALGDTGRSFVVGFGVNPPSRPHHRGSSCPMMPGPCSDLNKQADAPNPHTLFGALVGGPGQSDQYRDDRNNYINNEVACDYNAGFQSAVAGLKSLHLRNILDR